MKRFAIHCLTAVSALLCVLTIVLWVRSYCYVDSLVVYRPDRHWTQRWIDRSTFTLSSGRVYEADSRRGGVRLMWLYNDGTYWRAERGRLASAKVDDDLGIVDWSDSTVLRFGWEKRALTVPIFNAPPGGASVYTAGDAYAVYTPHAFWVVLFALLPAVRVAGVVRRRRRVRQGCCAKCGYDLRASGESCPECGASVTSAAR